MHAIGDRANRIVLDAFEATREAWGLRGLRQRIEHVQVLHPDDLPRFAALGVLASVQPIHATQDMDLVDRLWGARGRYAYASAAARPRGAPGLRLDAPVETPDPGGALRGRRPPGGRRSGGGWYPEERISLEEALRAYTTDARTPPDWKRWRAPWGRGKWADVTLLAGCAAGAGRRFLETTVTPHGSGGQVVCSAT